MSLLSNAVVSPSRVRGVYRYVLSMDGEKKPTKDEIKKVMSPDSLIEDKDRSMISNVLNESVRMGLLNEDEKEIFINPDLPVEAKSKEYGENLLPQTIFHLISDKNKTENHNICQAIAWYLTQDIYKAPGSWKAVEEALFDQVGGDRLCVTNDIRFGQLKDWIVYLGFAWIHHHNKAEVLVPDPTCYLREKLKDIFRNVGTTLPVLEVMEIVAGMCPVLEHGHIRKAINKVTDRENEEGYLSSVTSFAWQRLRDEKNIELTYRSDANVIIFPGLQDNSGRVSEITWVGGGISGV